MNPKCQTVAEDCSPATSKIKWHWEEDETYIWELEVREQLPHVSWRMGEMTFRGTFDGELFLSLHLVEMPEPE